MTAEEITRAVSSLRDLISVLAAADPADQAQIYSQLGLPLTYDPGSQTVRAESWPLPMYVRKCPRSNLNQLPTRVSFPLSSRWGPADTERDGSVDLLRSRNRRR
jgi:hypothetical protein